MAKKVASKKATSKKKKAAPSAFSGPHDPDARKALGLKEK